jgi:hypothetical protein
MAKTRKGQPESAWFLNTALKVLFFCMAITGSAVGYVWQKGEIVRLGQQIHAHEVTLSQLTRNNQSMADTIAILRSPVKLDERVRALNLGLRRMDPGQVVQLTEPAEPPAGRQNELRPLAARTDEAMPP